MEPLMFFVNGVKVLEDNVDPECNLLQYLRSKLRLKGSKLGCGEGGCSACTVLISSWSPSEDKLRHWAATSCLVPLPAVHGMAITTVEGLGSIKTRVHAIQERIAKFHGTQCGFCTPGFVMSMAALLRNNPNPSFHEIETALQGNLCRCTGYRPILEAFYTFAEKESGCGALNCCQISKPTTNCNMNKEPGKVKDCLAEIGNLIPYNPRQDLIFPPELKIALSKQSLRSLLFYGPRVTWYRPVNLQEVLSIKNQYPEAKMVVGNTEIGIEMKFKGQIYEKLVHLVAIPELHAVTFQDNGIEVGAAVTLTSLESVFRERSKTCYICIEFLEMLNWFAGPAIRNVASIGGNIMTGSPISDFNPLLMAAGAILTLTSQNNSRYVEFTESFYTGYRQNIVNASEILASIFIPCSKKGQYFKGFKQARRREDDIAIVNAGFSLEFAPNSTRVVHCNLVFGGMGPTIRFATKSAASMINQEWNEDLLSPVLDALAQELQLSPNVPGGMSLYRQSLALSFLFKFFIHIQNELNQEGLTGTNFPESYRSALFRHRYKPIVGSQLFSIPRNQPISDPIGRPLVHHTAYEHATGEAVYSNDIPLYENELHLAFVTSTKAHAYIKGIDASKALQLPGIHAVFTSKSLDVVRNKTGSVIKDDEVFASQKVSCVGQIIAAVVADNYQLAQEAAKLVLVTYEELKPILTLKEAIESSSYFKESFKQLKCGDVEKAFEEADVMIEGDFSIEGQEHFYLETQVTVAVPKGEQGEMEVFTASQSQCEAQELIAHALGVPANRIVVRVKRLGGGFGGKETRSMMVTLPVAIAAHKLQRPVRCSLDRDEDMQMTGGRHPFWIRYKVGASKSGRILALEAQLYANGGYCLDLSASVMGVAVLHSENAYRIPNLLVEGKACKTNLPSNTAFRCFGRPQAMLATEVWIEHLAKVLDIPAKTIREINLSREGDIAACGQEITDCTLQRCWDEVLRSSNYEDRHQQMLTFNQQNRWRKRGLAIVPCKFGVSFGALFMNQAGALVLVYRDGSVLVSHGGTEMGQGLHVKMMQIVSRALGVSIGKVHISEASTNQVPNASPTAASCSSDLNGAALINACQILNERLTPYKATRPDGCWEEWIKAAYTDRVSLSATGFYKTPDLGWNPATGKLRSVNYFSFGVACSEVEIDCLTGDHEVVRVDIVMDVGESLNPAIDIGQIEGAFVQGYGLYALEQLQYSPTGALLTKGPGTYKIPGVGDIPREFNVALLRDSSNKRAVYSSKAVGEPPLFLAASMFIALRNAIDSARSDVGDQQFFSLDSPATAERIRVACKDHLTIKVKEPPVAENSQPWTIHVGK